MPVSRCPIPCVVQHTSDLPALVAAPSYRISPQTPSSQDCLLPDVVSLAVQTDISYQMLSSSKGSGPLHRTNI